MERHVRLTDKLVTVCTPVAPYHITKIEAVKGQVALQTIPCEHVIVIDHDSKGAGWARNRALEKVETPYVSFLDCDDEIDPTFMEKCLSIIKPNHYVYTAWWEQDKAVMPPIPDNVFYDKTYHIVTTLLHTENARRVGWNEDLVCCEDLDFYLHCLHIGICCMIYPEALFTYSPNGQRSKLHHDSPIETKTLEIIKSKFGKRHMACCNGDRPKDRTPMGTQLEGDVLALVHWNGNRMYYGKATGRQYGRIGAGYRVYMNPADVEADSGVLSVEKKV